MHQCPTTGGGPILAEIGAADEAINNKWEALGRSPGEPLPPGHEGLIGITGGWLRHYARGTIYLRTGSEPFFLNPATNQRYDQLGGPRSFLGWPVSDFLPDPEQAESGVTRFENGAIYFWPDVGAIEMQEISLRYVGLHCFGETDEWSGSDEPFVTFGVVPTLIDQRKALQRVYQGVDAGESRGDLVELYRGLPFGVAISVTVGEHDQGDPDKYRAIVERAVDKASEKVVEAIAEIPAVGAYLAVVATLVLLVAEPAIADAANELLGTGEDVIGTVRLALTPKDMMRLTRVERQDFHGIQAHLESPLISDNEASYKAYFDVEVA
jgi:hypothetical protein